MLLLMLLLLGWGGGTGCERRGRATLRGAPLTLGAAVGPSNEGNP
jgi:hypothetical protein